jgi:hypothetical protein
LAAAGFAWVTLEVRHLFHPDAMGFDKVPVEERGALGMVQSVAYGAVVMGVGIGRRKQKRLAVLAVIGLVGSESLPGGCGRPGRTMARAVVPWPRTVADQLGTVYQRFLANG